MMLDKIIKSKRKEVKRRKEKLPLGSFKPKLKKSAKSRSLAIAQFAAGDWH